VPEEEANIEAIAICQSGEFGAPANGCAEVVARKNAFEEEGIGLEAA
jgi:hypothetical protein